MHGLIKSEMNGNHYYSPSHYYSANTRQCYCTNSEEGITLVEFMCSYAKDTTVLSLEKIKELSKLRKTH